MSGNIKRSLSLEQLKLSETDEERAFIQNGVGSGGDRNSVIDNTDGLADVTGSGGSSDVLSERRYHYLPDSISSIDFKSPLDSTQVFLVTSKWTNLLNSISVREFLLFRKSQEFHLQKNSSLRSSMPSELILINTDTVISDCLNIFKNNSILSAPIVESTSPITSPVTSSENGNVITNGNNSHLDAEKFKLKGMVDLLDIIVFLLSISRRHKRSPSNTNTNLNTSSNTVPSTGPYPPIMSHGQSYQQSIKQSLNSLQASIIEHIPEDYSLLRAAEIILNPSTPFKSHRLPVLNSKNEIVGLLSLTDILYISQRNIHLFNGRAKKRTKQLKILNPVVTIPSDTKSSEAFSILLANRIKGIAIVDKDTGRLLTYLDCRDLRNTPIEKINFSSKTISDFLLDKYGELNTPLVIKENDTLVDVLNLMCDNNSHRVYMVDEHFRPITVTTIGDIVSEILNC